MDIETIKAEIEDDNPFTRCNAVNHLAGIEGDEALRLLYKLLGDENSKVRYAALTKLVQRSDISDVNPLLPLLDDENETIKVQCVTALGIVGDKSVIDRLFRLLDGCPEDQSKLRATIVQTLGRLAGLSEFARLKPFLDDRDDRVRANAVEAVASLWHNELGPALEHLLDDPNNRVKGNAVVALWRHAPKRCLRVLEQMASQDSKWFRLTAVWAAGEAGSPEALASVFRLLDDVDTDVRIFAIKTIARIYCFDVRKALEQAASDTDSTVAYYARKALSRMDENRAGQKAEEQKAPKD